MSWHRWSATRFLALLPLLAAGGGSAVAATGQQVLQSVCAGCHAATPGGGLARIDAERKTPEGWEMTISRMQLIHGVTISEDDKATLVKYLADHSGLAPAEAAPYRGFLEHRPDVRDVAPTVELGEVCARCHSFGRVALQHRDAEEWVKSANFHLGQYPSAEYSEKGRDREWWKIASVDMPPILAKLLPYQTPAWSEWQHHARPDLTGTWRVVGHAPGQGDYQGRMVLSVSGPDAYDASFEITWRDGHALAAKGSVLLYTNHEWRAEFTAGSQTIRQVLDLAEDGSARGRWFDAEHDERGGDLLAVPAGTPRVLAVSPAYLRAGQTAEIEIDGTGLTGDPTLGDGVRILQTVARSADRIVLRATADAAAPEGRRDVAVGGATLPGGFVVYRKLAAVRVEPEEAIARVGGNGGPIAPVTAQFEAVGYLAAPDGDPAKAVRIGVLPATWLVAPFDQAAVELMDTKFAGRMLPSGEFVPAGAGPDPKRKFGTNNAGNLKVIGTVSDNGAPVVGSGHLIVTVQRWIKPDLL